MKIIIIILLVFIVSCKNETRTKVSPEIEIEIEKVSEINTENQIDQSVYDIWNRYTKSNPKFINDELPDSWFFHNNEADANRLADLVVTGKKKASSGLYYKYKEAKADLQEAGTKHIITNFSGKAQAIIEIVKVDTIPFNEITKRYAELDMGTHKEPLKQWKKVHWDFFSNVFEDSEEEPTEDMLVVCEWFETIWNRQQ
ncbi:ASCH domain-containing protein [uncultured Winogradskyella sp.]|uniref:ASCH domain-containing protein n=1 Tax=uncultured Winogradskyella sp. TaxID=395353 RepID=UPI0030EBE1D5|tara:strand:- start:3629 stop:4225 length:597 start_codon:yes stop_codon:yes gene_type:complete